MNDANEVFLAAEDVHKSYHVGGTVIRVLRGLSLAVKRGEAVAITGASGVGKSTLLHILGGLDHPDRGRILLEGQDIYALGSGERTRIRATRIGFVFQAYHLLPELDVLQNVLLPGWASPSPRPMAERVARAMDLLEAVGLTPRARHRPVELSGGEQQRVAIARALFNDPDLVLADEPTGNLDAETGEQVLRYLFALTRQRNRTLVVATHNEDVAARCDRRLRLREGSLA